MTQTLKTAVFANGCFWCTEAVFKMLRGVHSVMPGYTGGSTQNPSYDTVSMGMTGHAEAIKIEYEPSVISYDDLLAVFFNTHNPTTLNRQGNDVGTQYRSVVFYQSAEEREKAEALIKELNDTKAYDTPVVTAVEELKDFYEAEYYHRDYYEHNKDKPYCQIVIAPKLEKLQKQFARLMK